MLPKKTNKKKTIKRNRNLNERAVDIILEIIKVFEPCLKSPKQKYTVCTQKKTILCFNRFFNRNQSQSAFGGLERKKKGSITKSLADDRAFINGASAPLASQGSERGLALTLGKPLAD